VGRKAVFLASLVLFGAASAACAYSSSAGTLIAGRAVLGLGAACLLPMCIALLVDLFGVEERQRAITIWVTANAIGIPLGPIVGGWLLSRFWWGSVFLINIPVVAVALIAGVALIPRSAPGARKPAGRLDLPGILTSSAGLVLVTYGIIEIGNSGWSDAAALASVAGGLAALVAFVAWERRLNRAAGHPLVDPTLFRSPTFTWGTVLSTVVSFAIFGVLFAVPQYFQAVNGADAFGTGLRLLPFVGGMLVGARIADRLAPKAGDTATVATGFILLAVALLIGKTSSTATGYGFTAAWLSVAGAGLGFSLPIAMNSAVAALPPEQNGVGSALVQAVRQVGGTLGVAVLGAVLSSVYRRHLALPPLPSSVADHARSSAPDGVWIGHMLGSSVLASVRAAFVDAMDAMLWVCAGVAVLGTLLTLMFLPRRAESPAGQPSPEQAPNQIEVA
jgi:EmrB/QacA subfamily drug resistance transporter